MDCHLHPGTVAAATCAGCAEPFCVNCLVPIRGAGYCASCKRMAVPNVPPSMGVIDEDATGALKYAVLAFFCFGIVLGPMAVSRAMKAKEAIRADPTLGGSGRADAAIVLGSLATLFWLFNILQRVGGR